jgi:YggT family protein
MAATGLTMRPAVAPFTVRAKAKSRLVKNSENRRFQLPLPARSLVWEGWNRYLASTHQSPEFPRMRAILEVILIVLDLYVWLLIASAILSWLIAFNVVNTRNQFVAAVAEFLYRITEPVLAPIRSVLPNFGGLDISPIILILIIILIQKLIAYNVMPYLI